MALMQMNTGIYKITCIPTGRIYIGSSVNIKKRWREHVRMLGSGNHHSRFMQRAWLKHGAESFSFEKLIVCDKKDLLFYEQRAIDAMSPDYNSAPVAGSQLGYRHTPETRAKMSASRAKDFSPMAGRKHTPESIKKISQNRSGKGCGPFSDERKAKISAAMKGRVISKEARERISKSLKGRKQSTETIAKRSAALTGRSMPEGFSQRASEWMSNRVVSQETREKSGRARAAWPDGLVIKAKRMLADGCRHADVARETGMPRHTVADISCGRKYGWVKL